MKQKHRLRFSSGIPPLADALRASWRSAAAALAAVSLLLNLSAPLLPAMSFGAPLPADLAASIEAYICSSRGASAASDEAQSSPQTPKPEHHRTPWSCPLCPNCVQPGVSAALSMGMAPALAGMRESRVIPRTLLRHASVRHTPFAPRGPPLPA